MNEIKFNLQGDNEEIKYQIIVEMAEGQLFQVNNCSEATLLYKVNRVRHLFKGKRFFIRKQIITTQYLESERLYCN